MDNTEQDKVTEQRGNVMDVQVPNSTQSKPVMQDFAPRSAPESGDQPAPQQSPVEDPAGDIPVVNPSTETEPYAAPEQARPGLSAELLAQAEKETKGFDARPGHEDLLAAHAPKKRKKPVTVIVVAIVLALTLAGVAVYAYLQSQPKANDSGAPEATSQSEPAAAEPEQPATPKDVDDITKELDSTINASPEAQEIPESGLNEEAVGL